MCTGDRKEGHGDQGEGGQERVWGHLQGQKYPDGRCPAVPQEHDRGRPGVSDLS